MINYFSPDGTLSPFPMWCGRKPEVEADRLIACVLRPHSGVHQMDNSDATVVNKIIQEANKKQARMDRLLALFEEVFMKQKELAVENFKSRPIAVGDTIRTSMDVLQAKLDPKWSEKKTVRQVKGNVVYAEKKERPYKAWQVKVVPKDTPEEEEQAVAEEASEAGETAEDGAEAEERTSSGEEAGEQMGQVVQRRRGTANGEAAFLQSLLNRREGKRRITPTVRAREAAGEEGEQTTVVPRVYIHRAYWSDS